MLLLTDDPGQYWQFVGGGPVDRRHEWRPRVGHGEKVNPIVCLFSKRQPGMVHVYCADGLIEPQHSGARLRYRGLLSVDDAHVWVVRCKKREGVDWKGPDASTMA